jgi:hypothetical protein
MVCESQKFREYLPTARLYGSNSLLRRFCADLASASDVHLPSVFVTLILISNIHL